MNRKYRIKFHIRLDVVLEKIKFENSIKYNYR